MSNPPPIFIVGSSRSGTTLLAAMLNAHPRIACGPEVQILNKIKPRKLQKILSDRTWPKQAIAALTKIDIAEQRVVDAFGLKDTDVEAALKRQPPGVAALFEAIVGVYAAAQGKPRWAEKTPRHLLHLDTLRTAFPRAPIIRMVRDPRDSALSMRQLPWASETFLANLYLWNEWYTQSDEFFTRDSRSLTVVYEQLIAEPQRELKRICSFIGEAFDPAMLDTGMSARAVATPNEPWKQQVSGPLDPGRLYRWKRELSEPDRLIAGAVCKKWLDLFGYESADTGLQINRAHGLDRRRIEANLDWLQQRSAQRQVYLPSDDANEHATMTFFLDDVAIEGWLDFLRIFATLLKRRLQGRCNLLRYSERNPRHRGRHGILSLLTSTA